MMVIDNRYSFGDVVYLKTDREQAPRIVFAYKVTEREVLYELACGEESSLHYGFELSLEPNVLISLWQQAA